MRRDVDIAIVGAGPAGLHAALKAAILNHRALLVDKGREFSRVSQAPAVANVPGDPGIPGPDLLERGRRDLAEFRAESGKDLVTVLEETEVATIEREGDAFLLRHRSTATGEEGEARALSVVLATGIVDRKPGVEAFHRRGHSTLAPYVHRGEVGYCILCEGWSIGGKPVAVVGAHHASAQIALDAARQFGASVTLLTDGEDLENPEDAASLEAAGVRVEESLIERFHDEDGRLRVEYAEGGHEDFEKCFITLGWYKANNELAVMLGARTTRDGYVVTDENCEVVGADGDVIRGLFAVGDLRAGTWKQVVTAWGDAEIAVITAYAYRLPSAAEARGEVRTPPPRS